MTSVAGEAWFRDPALRRIMDVLNAEGGEARVVGGAVRNALMGMPVGDIDVATTLRPEEVVERAKTAGIKAVPTGIDHGTVTLVLDGQGATLQAKTTSNDVYRVIGLNLVDNVEIKNWTIIGERATHFFIRRKA